MLGDPPPRRFLTADLPPVRGRFRESPDDFFVDEVPAYEPSGAGTHTYLRIEKRGISTPEAVRRLAARLGRRPRDIGYAGLKDTRAVTRQTFSIEHVPADLDLAALDQAPELRVLSLGRHTNKLRRGHLRGNRFCIRLRDVPAEDRPVAREALGRLAALGLPNAFGAQRFGSVRQTSARLGLLALHGDEQGFLDALLGGPLPEESARVREARALYDQGDLAGAYRAMPPGLVAERGALRTLRKGGPLHRVIRAVPHDFMGIYVSAAQSLVFNALLNERIDRGTLARLEQGDVAYLHGSGGAFVVEDPQAEQARVAALELSPAGPLFGPKLLPAAGAPGEREAAMLRAHRVTEADLASALVRPPPGARRPYRIPLAEVAAEDDGPDLVLRFLLPAGAYATGVIGELKKEDVA